MQVSPKNALLIEKKRGVKEGDRKERLDNAENELFTTIELRGLVLLVCASLSTVELCHVV